MNDPQGTSSIEAFAKVAIAWIGAAWGSITLQKLAFAATIVYTVLQIYLLWRDKIRRRR